MFRTLASWLMRGSVVDLVVRGGLHVIDIRVCLKVTDSYMHMRAEPEEGSVVGSAGGDAGAPGAGAGLQLVLVEAGETAVVEQLLAADPEMPGAAAAAGVDQLRNRGGDRLLADVRGIEGGEVGQLARLQGADLLVQAEGAGAVQGGHAQRGVGAEGGGAAGHGLGQQGGGTGLAEQ